MKKIYSLLIIFSVNAHCYDYDLIIIGGGISGFVTAVITANKGLSVLLITDQRPGGVFRGDGDTVFNSFLYFGYLYHTLKKEDPYIKRDECFSLSQLWKKIEAIEEGMYSNITYFYAKDSAIEIAYGKGRLIDPHTVAYNSTMVTAEKIVIATGAKPFIPPIKGLEKITYYTYKTWKSLSQFPRHVIIYGGGRQATATARIFSLFGVKVTLIHRSKKILRVFDDDIKDILINLMEADGVNFVNESEVVAVEKNEETIIVTARNKKQELHTYEGDCFYIAVGTQPTIDNLNLDAVGIAYTQNGIVINSKFQTSISSIYAIGDVTEYPHQSRYVTDCAKGLAYHLGVTDLKIYQNALEWITASVLFYYPTLLKVGLSEMEVLKKYGSAYHVYTSYYKDTVKGILSEKTVGIVKYICDISNKLLGVQIIGQDAEYLLYKLPFNDFLNKNFSYDAAIVTLPSYLDLIVSIQQKIKNGHKKEKNSNFWEWIISFFVTD